MKYWIGQTNDTKIVAISEEAISIGNPPNEKVNGYVMKLTKNEVPSELFSIPISYIKTIEMKDIGEEIKIYFGQESSETIKNSNQRKKEEIFEALKNSSPKFQYTSKEIGPLGAAKKPLTALFIFSILFGISYYMAILLENNELYGNQVAILLAIASLGSKNIINIFGVLFGIIAIAIYKKMSETHTLHSIKRKD